MTSLTGEVIFMTLCRDRAFHGVDDARVQQLRPLAEAMPELLGDLLANELTVTHLLEARRRCLRYCIDNSLADSAAQHDRLLALETEIERHQADIAAMLAALELDNEAAYLVSEHAGFGDHAYLSFVGGTLTVEELLRLQPGVYILNKV